MGDLFHLERFVDAQDEIYEAVRAELARGKKMTHWMWFVFPQLKGLGFSSTAQYFGIASRAEGHAYWMHPVLGPRLKECTELVLAVQGKTAREIFGTPDDLKFRSSMTLFAAVAPEEEAFRKALEQYYGGTGDSKTIALLNTS